MKNKKKLPKYPKGGMFKNLITGDNSGLRDQIGSGSGNKFGDMAMDTAVYGANYLLSPASVPYQALTGKSLPSALGYEAKSDFGKSLSGATDSMAQGQKQVAPMMANMFGGPAAGMATSGAQQMASGYSNNQQGTQYPQQSQSGSNGMQMANMGMQMMPMMMGMMNQANQSYNTTNSGIGMNTMANGGTVRMGYNWREGGMMKPFYNTQHQPLTGFYPNGGITNFYPNGGQANAQIEKQENFITPQGEFGQANGPSHENGGVNLDLPSGTIIYSDKLKPKGSNKTFAQLNKANDTTKDKEILEDRNSTNESKKSAKMNITNKEMASKALFEAQEALKQSKVSSYSNRTGMNPDDLEYRDGGIHIKSSKVGSLHKHLGIPEGKKIPASKLAIHANDSPAIRKKKQFAINARQWKHEEGGVHVFPGGGMTNPFAGDPNYNAWSQTNQLKNYQGVSDQPTMMYNPANYKYDYYNPNQSYLPKQVPQVNPNIQPVQFGPNMNYNPNNGQYMNSKGINISKVTMRNGGKFEDSGKVYMGGYMFPYGGQMFNDNMYTAVNAANNPQSSQWFPSNGASYNSDVQQFYTNGANANDQISYPGNKYNRFNDLKAAGDYANKGNPNQEVDNLFDTGSYAGNPATKIAVSNNKSNPNWRDPAYFGASTLAQSAGPLAYLKEQGKRYDTQKFHQFNPTTLNDSTAIAEARRQANAVNASLAGGVGGSANNYMANRIQAGQQASNTLARIRQDYENANAGIKNQAGMFNNQNQYRTDDINAQRKGQALSNYYAAIGNLGTNTAQGMVDYRGNKYEQQKMGMLPYMFHNPDFDRYASNTGMKPKFDPYTGKPL